MNNEGKYLLHFLQIQHQAHFLQLINDMPEHLQGIALRGNKLRLTSLTQQFNQSFSSNQNIPSRDKSET